MDFEYNELKSKINKDKHGIDFEQSQKIWEDQMMLEVFLNFPDEDRYICIGKIDNKYWSTIITYREKYVRIISVRRARKKEIEHYENS